MISFSSRFSFQKKKFDLHAATLSSEHQPTALSYQSCKNLKFFKILRTSHLVKRPFVSELLACSLLKVVMRKRK